MSLIAAAVTPPSSIVPAYLSLRELSRYSGISVRSLRARVRDRVHPLPYHVMPSGSKMIVSLADFHQWMSLHRRVGGHEIEDRIARRLERARQASRPNRATTPKGNKHDLKRTAC